MEAVELKALNVAELQGKIRQWKEEIFRLRVKSRTSEMKDTSVFKKLRKDIARASTVLSERKNQAEPLPVAKQEESK